jgi:hypothetical protein
MKVKGKEIGPAEIYAEPHTMDGKKITTAQNAVVKPGNGVDKVNMSVGGISKGNYEPMNKHGEITMRGAGAATKGTKCRGPMA